MKRTLLAVFVPLTALASVAAPHARAQEASQPALEDVVEQLRRQNESMRHRLDVLMAPVDGGYTLDIEAMMRIAKRLKSRVVLPMHAFSSYSLQAFLDGLSSEFRIERTPVKELILSATTLPAEPTVFLMAPSQAFSYGED